MVAYCEGSRTMNAEFTRLCKAMMITNAERASMREFNEIAETGTQCIECHKPIKGDKDLLCFTCAVNTPDYDHSGYRKFIGKGL